MYAIRQTIVVTGDTNEYITNATNLTLTNLTPYTTYAWTIAASTSVGRGPYSTVVNVLMPEDGMQVKFSIINIASILIARFILTFHLQHQLELHRTFLESPRLQRVSI